ncbi:MAG: hypothetical protein PVF54_10630, partial [Anaerolineae bacterium]
MTTETGGGIIASSMLNGAVPGQAGSTLPQGVDAGTSETDLTVWRERALLCQERDLGRALAYFTFIADVTTLASDCRFAGDGQTLAARYNGLSFPACAFHSQDRSNQHETLATQVATLTRRLVAPHETFFCLVPGGQLPIVRDAYHLSQVHPEWQMFFRGDESRLDPGDAVPLMSSDLPEM